MNAEGDVADEVRVDVQSGLEHVVGNLLLHRQRLGGVGNEVERLDVGRGRRRGQDGKAINSRTSGSAKLQRIILNANRDGRKAGGVELGLQLRYQVLEIIAVAIRPAARSHGDGVDFGPVIVHHDPET